MKNTEEKVQKNDEEDKINKNFQTINWNEKNVQKPSIEQNNKSPMFMHFLLNDFNAMKYYQTDMYEEDFKKLEKYDDLTKIKCAFPSTLKANDPNFDLRNIKNAKFFVLRSTCDDDIHKAIKYGIWTSTYKNNILLNDLYKRYKRTNTPIFLIYTVVGSGQYSGIARMASEVQLKKTFSYWWEEVKWSGVFKINWVYIKDVLYEEVEDIRMKNGNKIVSCKDGSEVDFETGMEMLNRFKYSVYVSDIFEFFSFMDEREEKIRMKRDSMNKIINQLKLKGLIPQGPPKKPKKKGRKNDNKKGFEYIPKQKKDNNRQMQSIPHNMIHQQMHSQLYNNQYPNYMMYNPMMNKGYHPSMNMNMNMQQQMSMNNQMQMPNYYGSGYQYQNPSNFDHKK